jgi:hypothetical protein
MYCVPQSRLTTTLDFPKNVGGWVGNRDLRNCIFQIIAKRKKRKQRQKMSSITNANFFPAWAVMLFNRPTLFA